MTALNTEFNLGPDGDDVYSALIAAHEGLSEEASARLNVRLVLLLANQVGDPEVIRQAIAAAGSGLSGQDSATAGS